MPLYEHVFLARQDVSQQQVEALLQTYKDVITENGGSVEKTEYWGLKSLTYKIKKNRKAHFTLVNLNAPHEAVAEMERQMSLSTDILRFMTVKVDELEEGPSAMMRKSERDDRRGGGGRRPRHEDRNDRGDRNDRNDRGDRNNDRNDRNSDSGEE